MEKLTEVENRMVITRAWEGGKWASISKKHKVSYAK